MPFWALWSYKWIGVDGMGLFIIGHRSSKSIYGANKFADLTISGSLPLENRDILLPYDSFADVPES